jgi:hypothetical protein
MSEAVHFTEYINNLNQISCKPQTKNKKGGLVVYIRPNETTEDNIKIQLQTQTEPKCICPFGACAYEDDGTAIKKNLELSLESEDLVKFWKSVDKHNIETGIKHPEWFKKKQTKDQIKNMYFPLVTIDDTDKGYSPRLHTKVNKLGRHATKVLIYDKEHGQYTKGSMDDITKYSEVMVIVEVTGYWFQNTQWGMSVAATDVIIFPKAERKEFAFLWSGAAPTKRALPQAEAEESEVSTAAGSNSMLMMQPVSVNSTVPGVTLLGKDDEPSAKKAKTS